MQQPAPRRNLLTNIPFWVALIVVVVIVGAAMGVTASMEEARVAAEAAAEGEESDFELEDVYSTWSWFVLSGVIVLALFSGVKNNLAFGSLIQITLIIGLLATFVLVSQRIDRDIFEVGGLALICLTLVQIVFGNISPQANFRQSMVGVAIGGVTIAAIVVFSIWLVPYLIQLGR